MNFNNQQKSFSPFKRKIETLIPQPSFSPYRRMEPEIFHPDLLQPLKINLVIAEGFKDSPKEKQYGGRENRLPLPKHVITVDLPQDYPTSKEFILI